MKCRIIKSGHIVDMPRDIHTQVFIESGAVEKIPERNPVTMCNFHWAVSFSPKGIPLIEARCIACRLLDGFFEAPGQPKLEERYTYHKRAREFPPAEILARYREVRDASNASAPQPDSMAINEQL